MTASVSTPLPTAGPSSAAPLLVSDRLVVFGGAERVVLEMADILGVQRVLTPFTTIPTGPDSPFAHLRIETSFLQRLPGLRRLSKLAVAFEPLAVEQLDCSGHELVVSSSHAVAKGCITGPDQCHVAMVYSPMRYAWDLQHQYLREMRADRGLKGLLVRPLLHRLRNWDALSAARPDSIIAISRFIQRRIAKCWRRDSTLIYPPVAVEDIPFQEHKEDFYVTTSRMVPYKRMDLIVSAFTRMPQRKLVVIGDGQDMAKIRRIADGHGNIDLRGFVSTQELRDTVGKAKAYIFASIEDFGIAPLEAQAAGTPVIALGQGGALETIVDGRTGMFFPEQSEESLCAAVDAFAARSTPFAAEECRANALRFSTAVFRAAFRAHIDQCLDTHRKGLLC